MTGAPSEAKQREWCRLDRGSGQREAVVSYGATRLPVHQAVEWLAGAVERPPPETVPVAEARGRVAVVAVPGGAPLPCRPLAVYGGFAVTAADTDGAGLYAPLRLKLGHEAWPVAAGAPLPAGCETVVEREAVARDDDSVTVTAPVAIGAGVQAAGSELAAEADVLDAGTLVDALAQARLRLAGIDRVVCAGLPRIGLLVADADADADARPAADLLTVGLTPWARIDRVGDATACVAPPALWVVVGVPAKDTLDPVDWLGRNGACRGGGLALRPGQDTAIGELAGRPAVVLSAAPWTALGVLRGMLLPALRPTAADEAPAVSLPLGRKVSSPLGFVEYVPVAVAEGHAWPLARMIRVPPPTARGILTISEGSEGFAAGATVRVEPFLPGEGL